MFLVAFPIAAAKSLILIIPLIDAKHGFSKLHEVYLQEYTPIKRQATGVISSDSFFIVKELLRDADIVWFALFSLSTRNFFGVLNINA